MIRAFCRGRSELSGNQSGEFLGDIAGQVQAVVVVFHHGLGIGVAGERLHGAKQSLHCAYPQREVR